MVASRGLVAWSEGIKAELARRLPGHCKTERDKLVILVVTMLHVRSANRVERAVGLPRESDRQDMAYQWIARFLENQIVYCDTVMQPFTADIFDRITDRGEAIALILDQSKLSHRHQVVMLSVR